MTDQAFRLLPGDRLIGIGEVSRLTNRGKSIIYKMIRAGTFPGRCAAGWSELEVREWVHQQLAARPESSKPAGIVAPSQRERARRLTAAAAAVAAGDMSTAARSELLLALSRYQEAAIGEAQP